MTIAEFLEVLTRQMPLDKAASWDPVGLQLGDASAEADSVAVCHEVTPEVVAAAETGQPSLLIAYHPLLFGPITRLVMEESAAGRAFRLARAGVALAVVHTAFDVAPGGGADALGAAIGLEGATGFAPVWGPDSVKVTTFAPGEAIEKVAAAMSAAGGGQIGNYSACSFRVEGMGMFIAEAGAKPAVGVQGKATHAPEVRLEMNVPRSRLAAVAAALAASHPYEEPAFDVTDRVGDAGMAGRVGTLPAGTTLGDLAATVEGSLGSKPRVAGDPRSSVARAAVAPGSGSDFFEAAVSAGAHAIVTADVSHHRARQALDQGLAVVDPGHAATERPGVATLYAAVQTVGPVAALIEHDPDPWK
ncbi:MAG: Nif3-like dinuclear metal center hexameric protein [Myxococcales bacterium]|nr:Nif3-like dinuclear metal center hexameric protein [Myxococcales bacterium]